jgi:hypothetical protein
MNMHPTRALPALTGFLIACFLAMGPATGADPKPDWPSRRGPNHDGVSPETGWNPEALIGGPKEVWKINVGKGWSIVAIQGPRLFTMGSNGSQDEVFCLDADTGKILWKHGYDCDPGNYPGPRSTPVVNDKRVYTLILISNRHFRERYPSSPGAGVFLVDVWDQGRDRVRKLLESALEDRGLVLEKAEERLAYFTVIENTYLDIFLMLGALGMLLGSAGLGVVVFRNVQERRRELAMFRALGFSRARVFLVLLWEHGFLFAAGMALGMGAAGVAVMPSLAAPGARVPFLILGVLLAVLFVSGLAWTAGAAWLALRGNLLPALRED